MDEIWCTLTACHSVEHLFCGLQERAEQWIWGVGGILYVLFECQPGTWGSEATSRCLLNVEQAIMYQIYTVQSGTWTYRNIACILFYSQYVHLKPMVSSHCGQCILPAEIGNSLWSLWAGWIRDLLRASSVPWPSVVPVCKMIELEQWWNDTDRGKRKYLERNLSQFQFVHQNSHMECRGIEPKPWRWEAGD